MSYKRILLKLSGESLSGDKNFGISALKISHYVRGIKRLISENIEPPESKRSLEYVVSLI